MISRLLSLLPLLLLVGACGESTTDPEPTDRGSAEVLFVHGIFDVDSLEFQGRPLEGANIITFAPGGPVAFSDFTRYLRISAIPTELRGVDPDTDEIVLSRQFTPAADSAYSLFGYRNASGDIGGLLLSDNLAIDPEGRQLVRGLNLIAGFDSLQFRFIGPDSAEIELSPTEFAASSETFSPLFDSTSTSITLVVDIIDENFPGGSDNLFTGDLTLQVGRIFTFVAVGTPAVAEIVVVPHLNL